MITNPHVQDSNVSKMSESIACIFMSVLGWRDGQAGPQGPKSSYFLFSTISLYV